MTAGRPDAIELEVEYVARRNRLTVFFRAILVIPQLIVLAFLLLAGLVVAVIGWFAALALGRLPAWVAEFLGGVLAWSTRVSAYLNLLVDRYPPFAWTPDEDYPVRLRLAPGRLDRLTVLFRLILAIPAYVLSSLASTGMSLASVVVWLILVIGGRMPRALFEAMVAVLRYATRFQGYAYYLLTDSYPKGLFNLPLAVGGQLPEQWAVDGGPSAAAGASQPSISQATATAWRASWVPRSTGGKALVALFIVLGAFGVLASSRIPANSARVAAVRADAARCEHTDPGPFGSLPAAGFSYRPLPASTSQALTRVNGMLADTPVGDSRLRFSGMVLVYRGTPIAEVFAVPGPGYPDNISDFEQAMVGSFQRQGFQVTTSHTVSPDGMRRLIISGSLAGSTFMATTSTCYGVLVASGNPRTATDLTNLLVHR